MDRARWFPLIALFTVVAGTYFALQCMTELVWDDTPGLCAAKYDAQPMYWSSRPDPIRSLWKNSFGALTASGYRPLNALQNSVAVWQIGECNRHPALWYLGGAIVFGLLSVAVYLVARRYTQTGPGALLAVFLLFFSTPIITGGWPVACNCQATVPLALCGGLLVYWRWVESASYKVLLTLALAGIFLLGPWFREFIGLLPILILFEEVRRNRWPTWLSGLACVGFAHALFPTALIKWLAFPELPLEPVFRLGNLGAVLNSETGPSGTFGWILTQLHQVKWDVPNHFLVLFPPCLLILTVASLFVGGSRGLGWGSRGLLLGYGLLAGFLIVANSSLLGLWLILGLTLVLFRTSGFLALWFLFSFLPFLRTFTEQVHLAYAVVPASIGLAGSIELLFLRLAEAGRWRTVLGSAAACVLLVALADHALNLYSSFYVVHRINGGIGAVAGWFQQHVPARSIVICNALHAEDIRLTSGNHVTAYWTVSAGIPHSSRDLSRPEDLERMLVRRPGAPSCYFLDVDFQYRHDKVGYHSHKYVRQRSVRMEPCGRVHVVRARYPFLDPLKHWIPRRLMSFLGPPDLENDYYTGAAQNGAPFFREVYAEYHVYSIVGSRVARSPRGTQGASLARRDR